MKDLAQQVTVLGISNVCHIITVTYSIHPMQDHPWTLKAFKAKSELPYELLSDHKLTVANQYVGTIDLGCVMYSCDKSVTWCAGLSWHASMSAPSLAVL